MYIFKQRIYLYQLKNHQLCVKLLSWVMLGYIISINEIISHNVKNLTEIRHATDSRLGDLGFITYIKTLFQFIKVELNNRYKILDESLVEDKREFLKIVYCVRSLINQGHRLLISIYKNEIGKVSSETKEAIPSLTELYRSSNWLERENYDLFGVIYKNHPDLRRILTDYGFVGAPFRKDFPLIGYKELSYNSENGSVTYKKISLLQEYRNFDMINSWVK